ncbi:type VI secretion system gp25-like protein [Oleiphilus messinensis]|uniref:Type VI secretion system gp25-like protein n=1 Tax=Oleiphilus messinensis TaxID=141451 RepID=A0A1Y0IFB8_9GAMM|nr:type VI secretion system baseplate subunit TssE [Oleiphilus messinensis]ARU58819.1 type VI secretion system gp25-like protein [Oleiphilus messinensis]
MAAKKKKPVLIRASVLDRLIDNEPEKKAELETTKHQLMNQIRENVRRDLENLLNTRFRSVSPPDECRELDKSLVNYGLPDLNVINFLNNAGADQFCQLVEENIKRFEPRFKTVRVVLHDDERRMDRTLRFRIEAVMYADPAPEEIVFDSSLEPVTNNVHVESAL